MATSKAVIALIAVAIIAVVVFGIYADITYPRTIVSIPISITIGADSTTTTVDQQFLNDKVRAQVKVENGAALWRAQILNGTDVVWEHAAAQGEQQSYNSGWIQLTVDAMISSLEQ